MAFRTTAAALLALVALPASAAFAQTYAPAYRGPVEQYAPMIPGDVPTTGSITASDGLGFDRCLGDSAAEGNANQQTRVVKQYGQTAGGPRC